MLDETLLDRLFRFDGAFLRETCRLHSQPEGTPLKQFQDPRTCADFLNLYEHYFPTASRPALVSQWSIDLICVVLGLPMAAAAQGLRCTPDEPRVMLDRGMPVAQAFATGKVETAGSHLDLLQQVLSEELAPLWKALASAGRVAQRLLWNNAAAAIDVALDYFQTPHAQALRGELFRQRHWPDGTLNPLYGFLNLAPGPTGAPLLMRKICCLHYQLGEGRPHCDNCPLLPRTDLTQPAQA